jgi:hypothetical protein
MYLEKLFQMSGGYVLDFSDRTMGEFFAVNLDIDIYDERFNYSSGSKANRMRGLWSEGDDSLVGRSVLELIDYIESKILLEDFSPDNYSQKLIDQCKQIGRRLLGTGSVIPGGDADGAVLEAFLQEDFRDVGAAIGDLEADIQAVIRQRVAEIEVILTIAPLAAIFLIGSTLEGILLDLAKRNATAFTGAKSAPARDGTVVPLGAWRLNDLINVTHELGYTTEDVKRFSHSVRDFRNYIHPRTQATAAFMPTADTAKICFQVLKAALTEINAKVKSEETD